MNLKRRYFTKTTYIILLGCFLITACNLQSDEDLIDISTSEPLEIELKNALDIMYDDPETGLASLEDIIEKAGSDDLTFIKGKALWYQAYIYHRLTEDVSKAYFAYNESLKSLDKTDDAVLKAKVRNNLAVLNEYYGQYDVAINIYLEIIQDQENLEAKQLSNVFYNLGRTYKLKGDEKSFLHAEEAFTRSLEIAHSIEDHANVAKVNNQVGMMYKDIKDYDMARIAYKNTIRDYVNQGPGSEVLEYVGQAYHGMGVTFMEQNKYQEATNAFKEALKYKEDSESIFITKYDLGTVLFELNQPEEAVKTWKDALNEKHNKSERVQVEIYAKLTSTLAMAGKHEEAVKYAQIYNEHINDILTVGEKYQAENNRVLFADIIREYDEFNQVIPFYKEPWAIALMFLLIAIAVYAGSHAYYQSKLSTKVSDTRSEIQVEFQNIKID